MNRGKKLLMPNFDGTRPTADIVKTSMFALLEPYIRDAKVLDLFGGSGALGLECLSRYAKSCIFVDANAKSCELIRKNAESMRYNPEILKMDFEIALKNLSRRGEKFDIVLLDPPYHKNLESQALLQLIKYDLLSDDAVCMVEMAKEDDVLPQINDNFEELKNRTFGIKRILLLRPICND